MKRASLQDRLDRYGGALEMLRASPAGPYVYPIAAEFSNWRDEQRAWRESVALIDQSFHMTDLYVEGPDVRRLLSDLAVNSFANFGRDRAKQFVVCNHDGYLIGDMILFGLEDDKVVIVGRPTVANWVEFNAVTGDYDVVVERDERTVGASRPRRTFRYEVQGPKAWPLLEKVHGVPLAGGRFFTMGGIRVAGHQYRTLRHGMVGAPGLELWGPVEDGPAVKAALLAAGEEFGLRQVGGRAYSSAAVDSGWIPSPLPAIYSGEAMRPYREWLAEDSFDAMASLGGSFDASEVEDYYFTPWDLDYGRHIRYDHEFIGRNALEERQHAPHRCKVSLVWNPDDVIAVHASLLDDSGQNGKYLEMPTAHYATFPYDKVLSGSWTVGISTYPAYFAPDRKWVSLAVVESAHAAPGQEVVVVWGEPDGGSRRPVVERHAQMEIRATVTGWPWSKQARQGYRKGTS